MCIRSIVIVSFFFISCICQNIYAKENDTLAKKRYHKSISFYYEYGSVIQTHAFVKGENPNHEAYGAFHSISFKYGIHTDGRKNWEQLYGFPTWGVGLYQGFFTNDHGLLGNPSAVYAFIDLPLKRWKKWSLDYEIGFGLALNWKEHSLREDKYYYPIGSFSTVFVDMGFNASILLGNNFILSPGLTYTHFSNGAVKLPNLGVNIFGARLELKYVFKKRPEFTYNTIPKYQKEWEYIALLAPSMRQVGFEYIDDTGDTLASAFNYGILSFSTTFNRQISHKIKFGVGADFSFNEAYGADILMVNGQPEKAPYQVINKFLVGIYPSFELVLGRLSMIAQPGFYIYQKDIGDNETPTTYQRIGVKYHIWDHVFMGINIRAFNFSKADFIEWNIGYRIKWQKSYR